MLLTVYREKARIPAWCDRVLHKGDNLRQIDYNIAPLRFSDHRPVYATFQCTVSVIDSIKKDKLSREIYDRRRAEVGGNTANKMIEDEDLIGYDSIAPRLPPAVPEAKNRRFDGGEWKHLPFEHC
jgi:hypothetical protein